MLLMQKRKVLSKVNPNRNENSSKNSSQSLRNKSFVLITLSIITGMFFLKLKNPFLENFQQNKSSSL